jgi:hypothetical protein
MRPGGERVAGITGLGIAVVGRTADLGGVKSDRHKSRALLAEYLLITHSDSSR